MEEYKLVILGGGAVGKSCLTMQFLQHHFIHEYDPTIEDAYRKQVSIQDRVCLLDILDTAGQEEYSAMRDQYMRTGRGFILVYSIADRTSFDEVQKLRDAIYRVQDKSTSDKIDMVLVGNKCDLEHDREVTTQEGEALAKYWDIPFLEASAMLRINVEETFFAIVKSIRDRNTKGSTKKEKKSPAKKIAKILGKNQEQCSIL